MIFCKSLAYIKHLQTVLSFMPQYLHNRHFTLDEARMALPEVRSRIKHLLSLKHRLDALNYDIFKHEYFGGRGPNGSRFHPEELEELVRIVRYFEREGILIKSIQDGLIDFPHLRPNHEEVYLCWKYDEQDIEFWHGLSDGFSGRRPLSQL